MVSFFFYFSPKICKLSLSSPILEGGSSHFTLPGSKPRKTGPSLEPASRGTCGNCSERDGGRQKYVGIHLGWEEESEGGGLSDFIINVNEFSASNTDFRVVVFGVFFWMDTSAFSHRSSLNVFNLMSFFPFKSDTFSLDRLPSATH